MGGSINDRLAEQSVSAAISPVDPIIYPLSTRHPDEKVWLDIQSDALEDIRLVDNATDTEGVPIAAASGSVTKGPYRLAAILAGRGPRYIHSTNPVSISVVVSRDG